MPRKRRKVKQKVVPLSFVPTHCGFKLIKRNNNTLWRWDTLEDVTLQKLYECETNSADSNE